MKNIFVVLAFSATNLCCAQSIKFENPAFEKAVLTKYPEIDINKNGSIEKNEAENVKELSLMELNLASANDVKYFISLERLSLTINNIEKFKLSDLKFLKELYIARNKLKKFKISNLPALETLACGVNQLEKVTIEDCPNIESLNIMDCKLTALDITKLKKLKYLTVDGNKLKELDISQNPELIQININDNDIKVIDITKNQKLKMKILYIDEDTQIIGTEEQIKNYSPMPEIRVAD
jgi:Leucine-rich repeat (LRR) protein